MYCRQCGKKLQSSDRFCPGCGAKIFPEDPAQTSSHGFGSGSDDVPQFTLKPVFIPWLTVLQIIPLQIFFTIWGGLFFGGFSTVAIDALKLSVPGWSPFAFFAALFFFSIPLLTYISAGKTYEKTEYRFFPNRMEYYEGFWTVEQKSIDYRNITEVYMRKGIFEKNYGLGTVVLATPATSASDGKGMSGIQIRNIKDPDEVYRRVKDLVYRRR